MTRAPGGHQAQEQIMAKKTPNPEMAVETNPALPPDHPPQTVAPDEPASPASAAAEAQPDPHATISFPEPPAEVDQSKAAFSDEPVISEAQMEALRKEASRDNDQRDFTLKVLAARAPVVQDAPPPPVADRIRTQTEAEMAAGAKMNKHYEELQARYGGPKPEPEQGTKAVFRPGDFVPDPLKGQGSTSSRNL